jgi:uncharacterized alpha-E superfamily protein
MLSKVAERLYWSARYVERVENTARLLDVYDQLLYDLPREVNIGWYNLIALTSTEDLFLDRYTVRNEHNVVKFLLADDTNPSSMLSALAMIRENVRTTRDALPEDSWERVNEFYLFARQHIAEGINRSKRHEFLSGIIAQCQMLHGMWASTLPRDAGWLFIKLGQNIERADMTTRIIDSGVAAILEANSDAQVNFQQVVWGHVLRSDSAYTAYRRRVRSSISGPAVVSFLLQDEAFPRSLRACLGEMSRAAAKLPQGSSLNMDADKRALTRIKVTSDGDLKQSFREQISRLQKRLTAVHQRVSSQWFGYDPG